MDYYTVSSLYNGNIWVNTLQSFICFIVLASEPLYEVWKRVISKLTHIAVLIDVIFSLFFKNILLSDSINNPFLKSLWSIWKRGGGKLSGQPIPVLYHPYDTSLYPQGAKLLLHTVWSSLVSISACSLLCSRHAPLWRAFLISSLWEAAGRSCWSCHFCTLNKSSSLFPHRAAAPDHLGTPLLSSLQFIDALPIWGGPKLDAVCWTVALRELDGYQL